MLPKKSLLGTRRQSELWGVVIDGPEASAADLDEFLGVVGSAEDLSGGVAVGTRLLSMLCDLHHDRGPDLSFGSQHEFDQAAYSLNTRSRQTLERMTPSDKLAELLQ